MKTFTSIALFSLLSTGIYAQSYYHKDIKVLTLEIKELDLKKEVKELELNKLLREKDGFVFSKQELEKFYTEKDSLQQLIKATRKEIINVRTAKAEDVEKYEYIDKPSEDLTREDVKKMSLRDLKSRRAKIKSKIGTNKLRLKMSSVPAAEKANIEIENTRLLMKLDLIQNEIEERED